MKKVVAILAVLCAALALALVRAQRNADAAQDRVRADLSSVSNRAAELEIKLNHQERLASALGRQLTNCAETVNQRTAELERARADLGQTRAENAATQARLEAALRTGQTLEAQLDELRKRNQELESELQQARQQVGSLVRQLESLSTRHNQTSHALAAAHAELEQLKSSLRDPAWLRAQSTALTPPRRVTPPKGPTAPPPRPSSVPSVQLLPDGTVQVAE